MSDKLDDALVGKAVKSVTEEIEDMFGHIIGRETIYYDKNGNVTNEERRSFNSKLTALLDASLDPDPLMTTGVTKYYDADDNIILEKTMPYVDGDELDEIESPFEVETTYYDESGNILSKIGRRHGIVLSKKIYNVDGNFHSVIHYDNDGNILSKKIYNADGSIQSNHVFKYQHLTNGSLKLDSGDNNVKDNNPFNDDDDNINDIPDDDLPF